MLHHTLSFDEVETTLNEVADGIPDEIFKHLNGGIVLRADTIASPHGPGLFTMGTYYHEPHGMGRYIAINYGSFVRVAGHLPVEAQKDRLREVLYHELTHHLESLAGVRDLEIKDEIFLENYNRQKKDKNPPKKPEK